MSTVAFRDGKMSGDSIMSWGDQLCDGVEKVGRTENYLFGFAGRLGYMRPTYRWISKLDEDGVDPEDYYLHADDLPLPDGSSAGNALIASRDGRVYLIALDGFANKIGRAFDSIGSGGSFALGALLTGASAEDAVSCASIVDAYSGGRIHTWTFDDPVHCPNDKAT